MLRIIIIAIALLGVSCSATQRVLNSEKKTKEFLQEYHKRNPVDTSGNYKAGTPFLYDSIVTYYPVFRDGDTPQVKTPAIDVPAIVIIDSCRPVVKVVTKNFRQVDTVDNPLHKKRIGELNNLIAAKDAEIIAVKAKLEMQSNLEDEAKSTARKWKVITWSIVGAIVAWIALRIYLRK